MNTDKKNKFPWDTMDTTTLVMPSELIAYHLYRLHLEKLSKKEKGIKDNTNILASYLAREDEKKEEIQRCFQK